MLYTVILVRCTFIIMFFNNLNRACVRGTISLPTIRGLSSTLSNRATFGAGCYWGTEKFMRHDFNKKFAGVVSNGKVGFMGPPGAMENPTYHEVCRGSTQQVEVYDFSFNGDEEVYRELVRWFYSFHDPTIWNQQGNDVGTQYASVIFVHDHIQGEIAAKETAELQKYMDNSHTSLYQAGQITTLIAPATIFYPAEEDHQDYLTKNEGGYCNHRFRFKEWPVVI